jgi:hypothetical protein
MSVSTLRSWYLRSKINILFLSISVDLSGFAQSKAHSPAWGSTHFFNQLRYSTALPSLFILKHGEHILNQESAPREKPLRGINATKKPEMQICLDHGRGIRFSQQIRL